MKEICEFLGYGDRFPLISKSSIDLAFQIKNKTFVIEKEDNDSIVTDEEVKIVQYCLNEVLRRMKFEIFEDKPPLTYEELATVVYPLMMIFKHMDKKPYEELDITPIPNGAINDIDNLLVLYMGIVKQKMDALTLILSRIDGKMFGFKRKENCAEGNYLCLVARRLKREKMKIQEIERTVIKLEGRTKDLSYSREDLFLPADKYPEQIPIYIQTHALNRVRERVDCHQYYDNDDFLIKSIKGKNIKMDNKGTYWIKYCCPAPVGYLVANLIDGKIIIRTFLLFTQNGTEEGRKLSELSGLLRSDKDYLKFDRMTSFIGDGILKNEKIWELFEKAGCSGILEVASKFNKNSSDESHDFICSMMEKYFSDENMYWRL